MRKAAWMIALTLGEPRTPEMIVEDSESAQRGLVTYRRQRWTLLSLEPVGCRSEDFDLGYRGKPCSFWRELEVF